MNTSISGALGTLPLTIVLLSAAALAVTNAFRAFARRIANARLFSLLMLATAWWSFGYSIELNSSNLSTMLLWAKAEYLGIVSIPPLWFFFATRYIDDDQPIRWYHWMPLALIPTITLLLVGTNEQHHLIWATIGTRSVDNLILLAPTYGFWFWVHTAFSYLLILLGSLILLRAIWNASRAYRGQIFFLSASALTPLVGNILFIAGMSPFPHIDLTPLLFASTGLFIIWGDHRARLFAMVPIARGRVIEKMSDGVVVLNVQQQIADLNQAAEQLFSCPISCAIGRPFAEIYPDWSSIALPRLIGPDSTVELTLGVEPNLRTFDMRVSAFVNQRGQSKGYLVVLRDISERKRAENELQAQKALFENLVAVARAGAAQPALRATLSNVLNAAMSLTGASHGSMVLLSEDGSPMQSILATGQIETEQEQTLLQQVLQEGLAGWSIRERRVALVADTQSDTRWIVFANRPFTARSALAVPIPDQERVLGVITLSHGEPNHFNVDHVHLMQAAADQIRLTLRNVQMWEVQRELADQAEAASRAKSTFIANVSHELRTPLNAILGYSQLLAEEVTELGNTDLATSLGHITTAGQHLLDLINDVIDLSQIEAGQMELHIGPVDIATLSMNLIDSVQEMAAKNYNTLTLNCSPEIGIVFVDLAKLRQVLLNLLSNACKFTVRGQISCTISLEQTDDEPGCALQIKVCDTGIGMSPEQTEQLFTQFMQADSSTTRRHGGLGLGLALSQHLCRLMGGKISVVSELGRGSTFTVRLPAVVSQP